MTKTPEQLAAEKSTIANFFGSIFSSSKQLEGNRIDGGTGNKANTSEFIAMKAEEAVRQISEISAGGFQPPEEVSPYVTPTISDYDPAMAPMSFTHLPVQTADPSVVGPIYITPLGGEDHTAVSTEESDQLELELKVPKGDMKILLKEFDSLESQNRKIIKLIEKMNTTITALSLK